MTATQIGPAEPTTAHGKWLKELWMHLPPGPLGEHELEEAIIRITRRHPGDFAGAGAARSLLTANRCVTVRQGDGPRELIYERAVEFPTLPDDGGGYGSDSFNERLRRDHEFDLRALERERQLEWENSGQKAERDRLIALIDERIDARIGELRSVARIRSRLQDNDDAA